MTVVSVGLLCVTVLSVQPAVSASPDGEADAAEASPVAPVWPFVGMVDYAGTFVGIPNGERFDLGLRAEDCLHAGPSLRHMGYSDEYVFFARLRHAPLAESDVVGSFVVPWGDAAYPLLTNPMWSWEWLRSSDHPFVMDRFSAYSVYTDPRFGYSRTAKDATLVLNPEESVQPFTSLGVLKAQIIPWWPGAEVLRFDSDRGTQRYVLASSPRFDGFLSEIDRDRAEMLLEAEEIDYGEPEGGVEDGTDAAPTHSPRVQRVNGERTVWSMGASNWSPSCVVPYSVVQDALTGLALSCTDAVLLPIGLPSRPDLSDVPPLRGLDDCPRTSWASVIAVAENNEAQAQGETPRGEAG